MNVAFTLFSFLRTPAFKLPLQATPCQAQDQRREVSKKRVIIERHEPEIACTIHNI